MKRKSRREVGGLAYDAKKKKEILENARTYELKLLSPVKTITVTI